MREKEYTGTWSLHFQAPYVRHGRIVYRPVFHETVGRLGAKRFFSYFADDMPYQPKETPVLTGMLENNLAVFDNLEDGKLSKNIVLQYNVCRQCSRIFTAEKANKLYCPECAKERKREADRYAWEKRKRNMKKGSKKTERNHRAAVSNRAVRKENRELDRHRHCERAGRFVSLVLRMRVRAEFHCV